jgi:deoxycytidylate deaminase/dephospho-CoA kinase
MSTERPLSEKSNKQIVIGLTGAFGSGCSTLAKVLEKEYQFNIVCLSDLVRMEWSRKNNRTFEDSKNAPRKELQAIGNELRFNNGQYIPAILAEWAYAILKSENMQNSRLVFDSIRNMGEVEYLRSVFPDFYLIAVNCYQDDRWERVQNIYNGNSNLFKDDDRRDKNEEGLLYGQQVALCGDDADFVIRNDTAVGPKVANAIEEKLAWKVKSFIEALMGQAQSPTEPETYMSMAYCASLMSKCFKRQVGAIIVDTAQRVVSVGFNENPPPLKPCNIEFSDCYREIHIQEVIQSIKYCPSCGTELKSLKYPYDCPNCAINIYRRVLHDRALSRCSALHAEERAIIDAGKRNLKDCTLYVTAFPCFLCAHKILEVGIKHIWYSEPYPDADGLMLFQKANVAQNDTIILHNFEGVKARAFFRLFPYWRIFEEEKIAKKRTG